MEEDRANHMKKENWIRESYLEGEVKMAFPRCKQLKVFAKRMNGTQLLLATVVAGSIGLFGCATGGENRVKLNPPTPEETFFLAKAATMAGIRSAELSVGKLEKFKTYLGDARISVNTALQEEAPDLTQVKLDFVSKISPEYQDTMMLGLQVLVTRVRPLIQQGRSKEAGPYVQAAIEGALAAVDLRMKTLQTQPT